MIDLAPLLARPGATDLAYTDPNLPNRPMVLRCARPARFTPDTPVLLAHHGVLRNGADYRDFWLPHVDAADLLVIVPEFPEASFPGSPGYNFGNRTDARGRATPRAQWSYGVDGRLFQALRQQGLTRVPRFGMWGHSAGGQFVHRAVSLGFMQDVAVAVTANAGTYAMPDLAVEFPYGLGGTGMIETGLRRLLDFPMVTMAGTDDIDAASEHFPKEPPAMAQGGTRYDRAHRYIGTARSQAARLGTATAWSIIDVPGVDHDGERMAAAAAPVLAAALHRI